METGEWCPLFGALPDYTEAEQTETIRGCIRLIEAARSFIGTLEYLPVLKFPDAERVEKHTGFPAPWIRSARLLCEDSTEILFKAQHIQGSLWGNAWTHGRTDPFLTIGADQIAEDVLLDVIDQHAGIDPDFRDWLTVGRAFALLALGEAWSILSDFEDGGADPADAGAVRYLWQAETLLSSAKKSMIHVADSIKWEMEMEMEEMKKTILVTSEANSKKAADRQAKEKVEKGKRNDALILRKAEIKTKHPKWSDSRVANHLAKETTIKPNTIRQIIGKPPSNH